MEQKYPGIQRKCENILSCEIRPAQLYTKSHKPYFKTFQTAFTHICIGFYALKFGKIIGQNYWNIKLIKVDVDREQERQKLWGLPLGTLKKA